MVCVFIEARGLSLVGASGSSSLVGVCELLIALASLVEHRLSGAWASVAVTCRLSGCGIQA